MKKWSIKALVLLLTVTMFLTACNSTPAPGGTTNPAPKTGGKLTIGAAADILQLVPFLSTDAPSGEVHALIHDGLVALEGNNKIVPALATEWKTSADGKTWTFTLRKDVKFHDGSPFTSADVKFTYDQILDPKVKSNARNNYSSIEKIETPDAQTVVFQLKDVYAPFLSRMTMGIISKTYVEKKGFDKNNYQGYNKEPIGTGAWAFKEWVPETRLTLAANKEYWGVKPQLDEVVFRPIPEASVRLMAFENGEVDYLAGIAPDDVERIKKETNKYTVYSFPQLRYAYLAWNNQYEVFKDPALRQALTYATNKNVIIDNVLKGQGVKAITPYAPSHSFYDKNVKELYPFDVAKAKDTLEKAGYKKGADGFYLNPKGERVQFTTMVDSSSETFKQIALLLQQWFKDIGVDMQIKTMERGAMYDIMDKVIAGELPHKEYQAMVGSMGPGVDPDQTRYLHSTGGLNDFRYSNSEADKLIVAGTKENDPAKRQVIYSQLQEYLAKDLPMLFLYFPYSNNALSKNFTGMTAEPYGQLTYLNRVTRVK